MALAIASMAYEFDAVHAAGAAPEQPGQPHWCCASWHAAGWRLFDLAVVSCS